MNAKTALSCTFLCSFLASWKNQEQNCSVPKFLLNGVVAYPVMQAYGKLALEDNSEVGQAVLSRCSISCVGTSALYVEP